MAGPHRVALIPGDGIGPEVVSAGRTVLEAVAGMDPGVRFTFDTLDWGSERYLREGSMMPEDGIERLSASDAILLGAVGDPRIPDHVTLWGLLLPIRQHFEQYVNLRPVRLMRGAVSPLRDRGPEDIDMIYIRENTEGEYAGKGDFLFPGTPGELALQTSVFSRRGVERVIRYAFELGRRTDRSVTSISKGNALNYSAVLWDRIFQEVAEGYPDVATQSYLVDAAALYMVNDPGRFGVVVASNLFADILTDLGAAISGGMGLAASANLNPEGAHPSMFEPVHGSAPDIAGRGVANPMATILAVALLLEQLGHPGWRKAVEGAVEAVLEGGSVRPPDLGGQSGTAEVTEAVLEALAARRP